MLDVSVNPATARARLVWDPQKVRLGDLLRVLEHVGLRPHPLAGEPSEQLALLERRAALKRLAVAGFGKMQVMMFAVPLYFGAASGMDPAMREYMRLVSMLVSIPVVLYAGWPFYQGAWRALRARSISMDVPVSLGDRARVRRERVERAHRPRRRVLRLGDHVRVLPRRSAATSR